MDRAQRNLWARPGPVFIVALVVLSGLGSSSCQTTRLSSLEKPLKSPSHPHSSFTRTPRSAGWLMFGHDEFRTGQNENALWEGRKPSSYSVNQVNVNQRFGRILASPLIGANDVLYVASGGNLVGESPVIGKRSLCSLLIANDKRRVRRWAGQEHVMASDFAPNYTSTIFAIAPAFDVSDFKISWSVDISKLGNYTVETTGAITSAGILIQPIPGYLLFLDVTNAGAVQKCIPFNSSRSSPVLSSKEVAFLGSNDGRIYSVRIAPSPCSQPGLSHVCNVYHYAGFSRVVNVDLTIVAQISYGVANIINWNESTTGQDISSSPALFEGDVNHVFFGSFDSNIYAYDIVTGNQLATFHPQGIVQSTPSIDTNMAMFVSTMAGVLYKLQISPQLSLPAGCPQQGFACQLKLNETIINTASIDKIGGGLVVASLNGSVFYVNRGETLANGTSLVWRFPRDGPYQPIYPGTSNAFFATPSIDAYRNIYLATMGGDIVVLNSEGELVYRAYVGPGTNASSSFDLTASIAVGSNESFVLTGDGAIFALRVKHPSHNHGFLANWQIGVLVAVAIVIGLLVFMVCSVFIVCYIRNYRRGTTIQQLEALLYRNQGGWVGYSAINADEEEFIGIGKHGQTDISSDFGLPKADLPELRGIGEASRVYSRWPVIARAKEEKWYIDASEIELRDLIGSGGGGHVYRAEWHGVEVALKTMKTYIPTTNGESFGTKEDVEAFIVELRLLSRLRHPNIVQFLGGTVAPASVGFGIVTEYCERGSLWDVLKDERVELTWRIAIKILRGVGSALQYLHNYDPPILHRDMKSPNILVTGDFGIRLTDFGVSRFMPKFETKMTYLVGSPYWMAPEMFEESPYTEKADIYGLGIIMWEVLTRDEPFKDVSMFKLYALVSDGLRPAVPEWCPVWWSALMVSCWAKSPDERPAIGAILGELNSVTRSQYPTVQYPSSREAQDKDALLE